MKEFLPAACLGLALSLHPIVKASDSTVLEKARAERERVRALVEAGALPRIALEEAEGKFEEAADEAVLQRTLYGALALEELTEAQAEEMTGAAERLLERARQRLNRLRLLVEQGAMPASAIEPAAAELARRHQTFELAQERARLFKELVAIAQAEAALAAEENETGATSGWVRRFEGTGLFSESRLELIRRAFEQQFRRPLPVSAHGATALHRALGYDHRGRVDIALHPDQPEGRWLLGLLERMGVPHYAFRSPVPGKSTGAHIHLGPPSTRLRTGD